MTPNGDDIVWTAPRLGARLAALKGRAPNPSCYVIWRETSQAQRPEVSGYELPGQPGRRGAQDFELWLAARGLAGPERLAVSVLVIRESLDEAGLVLSGVLERRRGGVDGPYHGRDARVEFTGAARIVRRFRALKDGRLARTPHDEDTGASALAEEELDTESFAGEDAAVHAFLGAGAVILNRRAPTLFEDNLGLSGIIHARRADGVVVGCGVGWHGTTAYVLAGDFPRHDGPMLPPPELEAAVASMPDLIAHETRLDDRGFCVIAQRRGRQTLVSVRLDGTETRIEPYMPGRTPAATEDQRRWMIYAETYEARAVIDSWPTAEEGEIAVLTIDQDQEAWRHVIDTDGIEISRHAANDLAAAVLYRDRLARDPSGAEDAAGTLPAIDDDTDPEFPAPPESLLAKVRAYLRVTALLRQAASAPADAVTPLRQLAEPLRTLNAKFSAGTINRLLTRADQGLVPPAAFAAALEDAASRLRDELALTRIVMLPAAAAPSPDHPPFGAAVEARFPLAAYDIEEAMHCLALRRTTGAVLHAMRVMRHGLAGLETMMTLPPLADLTWARIIAAVRGSGHNRPELAAALDGVRAAWRSPGLPPAGKYTEEEAERLLDAVATFMRILAVNADGAVG